MIDRTELAEALARLDPRDREVLDYSLRRHVPDGDLAAVFGCGAGEVARMRARAVERLADDLGVQRGADLGHVLTALLDPDTWTAADAEGGADTDLGGEAGQHEKDAGGAEQGDPRADADRGARPAAERDPTPAEAEPSTPGTADAAERWPEAEPATGPGGGVGEGETPAAGAKPAASDAEREERPIAEPAARERKEPVLGMLGEAEAARASAVGDVEPVGGDGRSWSLLAATLIVVLVAVGLGSVLVLGSDPADSTLADAEDAGTRPFEVADDEVGDPFPSDPDAAHRYPIATIEEPTQLRDAPGGRPTVRISPTTEWDSPRVLSVADRRGDWLGVLVPELDNGEVGWVHERDVARLDSVGWAIKANLRERTLVVERDGEVVRRMPIGVGRADHPTPPGRYAVTDKLRVNDPNSPYGCCVLALTGHQTKLPVGWPGGDRLAIHATPDLAGLGEAVSLGCLRADPDDTRWMMDEVPLGTPVFVTKDGSEIVDEGSTVGGDPDDGSTSRGGATRR